MPHLLPLFIYAVIGSCERSETRVSPTFCILYNVFY